jgi:hypothetical protein
VRTGNSCFHLLCTAQCRLHACCLALPLDPLGICKLTDKIQTKKYFCGQSMNSKTQIRRTNKAKCRSYFISRLSVFLSGAIASAASWIPGGHVSQVHRATIGGFGIEFCPRVQSCGDTLECQGAAEARIRLQNDIFAEQLHDLILCGSQEAVVTARTINSAGAAARPRCCFCWMHRRHSTSDLCKKMLRTGVLRCIHLSVRQHAKRKQSTPKTGSLFQMNFLADGPQGPLLHCVAG